MHISLYRVAERRPHSLLFEYGLVATLSTAASIAHPIISNQNQYLAHALDPGASGLKADWLLSTMDPYPAFTWLASVLIDWGGLTSLRLLALLGNMIAVLGLHLLGRLLYPRLGTGISLAALTIAVSTLSSPWKAIPQIGAFDAFTGLAEQYIVSGYAQPAMFGGLILMALPTWLRASGIIGNPPGKASLVAATALTALACVLHPTYLIAVAIGMVAAFLLDEQRCHLGRLSSYAGLGLAVLVPSLTANPSVLVMAVANPVEIQEASQRFAFERIPHHTVATQWFPRDLIAILLISLGIWILYRTGRSRLAAWMGIVLVIIAWSAITVLVTNSATLALMFPWRISVFLVPLSAIVVATEIAGLLQPVRFLAMPLAAFGAMLLATMGTIGTLRALPIHEADEGVALVREVGVAGVGLIPLMQENIRLNALVAVYVDWKSRALRGRGSGRMVATDRPSPRL